MAGMNLSMEQRAGLAASVLAGAALLTALLSERWGGLVPCALCLLERWPYRVTIVLGAAALAFPQAARLLVGACALTMLAGAGLGAVHVGVEQGWWPSPLPECAAAPLGGGTMAERLSRLPAQPAKPCDAPAYLIPGLPVGMAAMNLVLSLLLAAGLAVVLLRRRSPS